MSTLFASGHAVDIVLLVIAAEAAVLLARRREAFAAVALALLPGVLILLAVRAALTGAVWTWVALPLAASFPVHVVDLYRRGLWRPRRHDDPTRSASTSDRR